MAYIHDFSDFGGKPVQIDYAAIRAMASALEGTNKPIIITSGIPVAPIHNIAETDAGTTSPRAEAENIAISYADKGVRPIIIRLPTVHGDGDHGFIAFAAGLAAKNGAAAYIGDGSNAWPAVHVKDAAEVYKRAVENDKLPAGTRLHAVQDTGVPFKQIAEVIGKRTGVEVKSVSKEEAGKYLEWLAQFASWGVERQSKLTREWLGGWEPKEKALLEDLETSPTYFAKKA
ncbi:hypothetical protein IAT38_007117 [Cryptococcus sp. DSM 104549]